MKRPATDPLTATRTYSTPRAMRRALSSASRKPKELSTSSNVAKNTLKRYIERY